MSELVKCQIFIGNDNPAKTDGRGVIYTPSVPLPGETLFYIEGNLRFQGVVARRVWVCEYEERVRCHLFLESVRFESYG